jgi:hypothetical protein
MQATVITTDTPLGTPAPGDSDLQMDAARLATWDSSPVSEKAYRTELSPPRQVRWTACAGSRVGALRRYHPSEEPSAVVPHAGSVRGMTNSSGVQVPCGG